MKVTILMPVYNAAKYLHDSIGSVIKQSSDSWEMIIIDDGSTDGSRNIIDGYMRQDARIKLLTQKNSGPGVARARAIQVTKTEYVAILDADDELTPTYVELMLHRAEETKADIVTPNVYFFSEKETINRPTRFDASQLHADMIIHNGLEGFSLTLPWQLHGWQMIRTSFAQKYYIESLASYSKFNSDEFINRLMYLKSNITACCNAVYKHRIDNGDSLTRSVKLLNFDYLKTMDKLTDLCISENLPKYLLIKVYNECFAALKIMLCSVDKLPAKDRKAGMQLIKTYYYQSYRKKFPLKIFFKAPLKTVVKFFISMIDYKMVKMICLFDKYRR